MNRRYFIQSSLVAAALSKHLVAASDKVNLALMGVRGRGKSLAQDFASAARREHPLSLRCRPERLRPGGQDRRGEERRQTAAHWGYSQGIGRQERGRHRDSDARSLARSGDNSRMPGSQRRVRGEAVLPQSERGPPHGGSRPPPPACSSAWYGVSQFPEFYSLRRGREVGQDWESSGSEGVGRANARRHWAQGRQPGAGWCGFRRLDWTCHVLPFNENRFHYNWHWHWNYGTGDVGNDGVHQIDLARWALGVEEPLEVTGMGRKLYFDDDQRTPDTVNVTFEYKDKALVFEMRIWNPYGMEGQQNGVAIYGCEGVMHIGRWASEKGGRNMAIESMTGSTSWR